LPVAPAPLSHYSVAKQPQPPALVAAAAGPGSARLTLPLRGGGNSAVAASSPAPRYAVPPNSDSSALDLERPVGALSPAAKDHDTARARAGAQAASCLGAAMQRSGPPASLTAGETQNASLTSGKGGNAGSPPVLGVVFS